MTISVLDQTHSFRRIHRRLRRELAIVRATEWGTWTTSSNLPHEIRLHRQSATDYLRVSTGMVIGVRPTKALLMDINMLNIERAFTRRFIADGNILVAAEMPVDSLRPGNVDDLVSITLSFARLDAAMLAVHGGRSVTEPPAALAPDVHGQLSNWKDVLRASGTATHREFNVWLDDWSGIECWLDRDESSLTVVLDGTGQVNEYPFCLKDLKDSLESLRNELDEDSEW